MQTAPPFSTLPGWGSCTLGNVQMRPGSCYWPADSCNKSGSHNPTGHDQSSTWAIPNPTVQVLEYHYWWPTDSDGQCGSHYAMGHDKSFSWALNNPTIHVAEYHFWLPDSWDQSWSYDIQGNDETTWTLRNPTFYYVVEYHYWVADTCGSHNTTDRDHDSTWTFQDPYLSTDSLGQSGSKNTTYHHQSPDGPHQNPNVGSVTVQCQQQRQQLFLVELLKHERAQHLAQSQQINSSIKHLWRQLPDAAIPHHKTSLALLESCGGAVQQLVAKQKTEELLNANRILRSEEELAELTKIKQTLCERVLEQEQALANLRSAKQNVGSHPEHSEDHQESDPQQPEDGKMQDAQQHIAEASVCLEALGKELGQLCLCPVSLQPMRQPVIATDLRTYDKDIIEKVLETKSVSPFTRAHMEKGFLRPNMLALELLQIMAKYFPQWEGGIPLQRPAPIPPVSDELIAALEDGNSDQAVELLTWDVDLNTLNTGYEYESEQLTLLQLCLCLELPKVACALIDRPDFRRTESLSGKGLLAIHMAAAFNYTDVCRKIVEDVGGNALTARTPWETKLTDPWGRCEVIPCGSTAEDCGRIFGHVPGWIVPES